MSSSIRYASVPGVVPGQMNRRPFLSTPQGGRVVVDETVLGVWEVAPGRSLQQVLDHLSEELAPDLSRAILACLVQAGLLWRNDVGRDVISPIVGAKQCNEHQLCRNKPASPFFVYNPTNPLISVILVAYNSREWLDECLASLSQQTYSPLEIILVDNGSSDGSLEFLDTLRSSYKLEFRTLRIDSALPFAAAVNRGVGLARGGVFFLLNPDVRLEPRAVAELAQVARLDSECAAVAAKLRFLWAPSFLNGLGNRVGPFSWGSDNGLGHLDLGQFDHWRETPSACFGAALVPRRVWESVGPLDEGFPMYYEDTEWCYRARLMGYRIAAVPQAVVFHAFGGRMPTGSQSALSPHKLHCVVQGRLRFAVKLLKRSLPRFVRNYLAEDCANFIRALARGDWGSCRVYAGGWLDFLRSLPNLLQARQWVQSRRKISDRELFVTDAIFPAPRTLAWNGFPELTCDIITHEYLPILKRSSAMPEFLAPGRRPHLLIVSNDVIDTRMAGPGIRYLEMARALVGVESRPQGIDVTLAVPNEPSMQVPGLEFVRYWEDRPGSLQVLVENCDVALVSGYMVEKFPFLAQTRTRLVVDLYDPIVLENLHYYLDEPFPAQETLNRQAVRITNRLAELGDFFICGNERQRDFWIGVLAANRRVNPQTFAQDPGLHSLIDIVGMGLPDRPPKSRPLLRGLHPCIPVEAQIVLWGGGVWNWLDPLTLIRAWPQVLAAHPQARLVFLGTRHPNPLVPRHQMAQRAEQLAAEIGEKDRSVVFFEWLSLEDREALLCEADVGVTLHPVHIETRYSLRARVLDYFWARLPVLITDGDVTSEWVRQYGLGQVVPPRDVDAVANALKILLERPKSGWAPAFEPVMTAFSWSRLVAPLERYCREGDYAPDRLDRPEPPDELASATLSDLLARARFIRRREGWRAVLHRLWRYIQWRLARP